MFGLKSVTRSSVHAASMAHEGCEKHSYKHEVAGPSRAHRCMAIHCRPLRISLLSFLDSISHEPSHFENDRPGNVLELRPSIVPSSPTSISRSLLAVSSLGTEKVNIMASNKRSQSARITLHDCHQAVFWSELLIPRPCHFTKRSSRS